MDPYAGLTLYEPYGTTTGLEGLAGQTMIAPDWVNQNSYTPTSTSGGTSVAGASAYDPQALAYYDNQIGRINNQIGLLDPQLDVGRQNITNSYQDQYNQLTGAKARNERDYTTNRTNTIQDQQSAKQGIDTRVRNNTTALQRILGRAGSGNSSAAQIAAPYAAGRAGSIERNQVQQKYGRNLQALDTNWNDTLGQYDQSFAGLSRQRDNQQNSLQNSINQTRANLLDTLAGLTVQRGQTAGMNYTDAYAQAQPYVSQIDQLLGQTAGLSRQYANPILQAAPVAYQAPSLDAYNYNRVAAPQANQPGFADQLTPYYAALFGDKRKELV